MKFNLKHSAPSLLMPFFLAAVTNVLAHGIWDNGMKSGNSRTEYESDLGTQDNPLTLRYDREGVEGCKFNSEDSFSGCPGRAGLAANRLGREVWQGTLNWHEACGGVRELTEDTWKACLSYKQSNYFETGPVGENYWMIIANNDPSFDQCNSGMPSTSLPIIDLAPEGHGLFQFQLERYSENGSDEQQRFHFMINSRDHDFYCAEQGDYQSSLPFLSVGAQKGAGNGGPVGEIGKWYSFNVHDKLSFNYEIVDYAPYSCLPETVATCMGTYAGAHSGFFLVAEWAGTNRMLFVELWRSGYFAQPYYGPTTGNWNWPIEESVFFPGAEIASIPVGHPEVEVCQLGLEPYGEADMGASKNYRVSASQLYRCADTLGLFSSEMPSGRIELDGVHWFSESYGTDGLLWVALDHASLNDLNDDLPGAIAYFNRKFLPRPPPRLPVNPASRD